LVSPFALVNLAFFGRRRADCEETGGFEFGGGQLRCWEAFSIYARVGGKESLNQNLSKLAGLTVEIADLGVGLLAP
jgi:hypothetical protein